MRKACPTCGKHTGVVAGKFVSHPGEGNSSNVRCAMSGKLVEVGNRYHAKDSSQSLGRRARLHKALDCVLDKAAGKDFKIPGNYAEIMRRKKEAEIKAPKGERLAPKTSGKAKGRDAQFSMSPAKVDAARKTWVAASKTADKLADECKAAEKLAEHWQEVWRGAKTPDEKARAGAQCDLAGRAAGRARRASVDANIAEEKAKQALPAGLRKRM